LAKFLWQRLTQPLDVRSESIRSLSQTHEEWPSTGLGHHEPTGYRKCRVAQRLGKHSHINTEISQLLNPLDIRSRTITNRVIP
jgi:hypothetical protein